MWALILGVLMWVDGHAYSILPFEWRLRLREIFGPKFRGFITLYLIVSVVLMVIGYRSWDAPVVYNPPSWGVHANNLLSLLAFALMGAGHTKSHLARFFGHPMLTGLALWSLGHLLVRGTWAAIILWGGMLIWSVMMIAILNKRDGKPDAAARLASRKGDLRLLGGTLIGGALIIGLHHMLI